MPIQRKWDILDLVAMQVDLLKKIYFFAYPGISEIDIYDTFIHDKIYYKSFFSQLNDLFPGRP